MYGTGLSLSIERQCYRADLDAENRRRRMRKECGDGQIGHGVVWYEPIRVGT